jgi:RNA polymerase sigma-70 factor, ECF subfamily
VFFRRRIRIDEFEEAAVPHLQELYRSAARLVGDGSEAQDLVQETYLLAWKAFHRFQPGTNCRAWLFKILLNEIRHFRRKRFGSKVMAESEFAGPSPAETFASEPVISEAITDEDVLAALDQLPLPFREVVLLADVQEFSYKEIGEVLQVPVGTVMSRLSRGRLLLRKYLADFARRANRSGLEGQSR